MSSFHFANKNILLGVSGSIAAYKSCELLRMFQNAGATTRVIMTEQATHFVSPLTFQALSGNEVHIKLVDYEEERGMGHINLARWADALIIAPASAALISRLAAGDATDLLTAVFLATSAPRLIAPAMNQEMWAKDVTQSNLSQLDSSPQTHLVQPATGWQACGDIGPGRLADLDEIVAQAGALFTTGSLAGIRVLINAGPTREPLDAIRYISNYSSGKMGYALAQAAVEAGAKTTLVSGPVGLAPLEHCKIVRVERAQQMLTACVKDAPQADVFIGAAAVADFRPAQYNPRKLPKGKMPLRLELIMNEDILMQLKKLMPAHAKIIGFAAETDDLEQGGRRKLLAKGLDMLCANNVTTSYAQDENEVLILFADGRTKTLKRAAKKFIAHQIMDEIAGLCVSK